MMNSKRDFILPLIAASSLFFVTNTKIYILVFVVYGLFLFFLKKFSVLETIFGSLLLALPFERGIRDWWISVVPHGTEVWMPGYQFYFGLSPKFILIATSFSLFFFMLFKSKSFSKTTSYGWLLIGFFIFSVLSTLAAENFSLALVGFVRLTTTIFIFFLSLALFRSEKIRQLLEATLFAFLAIFGLIGSWQFFARHPIGLFLEDIGSTGSFGYFTTEGDPLYRVTGFTGHPTFFGSLLSLLIPIGISFTLMYAQKWKWKNFKIIFWLLPTSLGLLALFATFSRSGWIATGISIVIFFWIVRRKKFSLPLTPMVTFLLLAGIFSVVFYPLLFSRLQTLISIVTNRDGWGRIDLIYLTWNMIKATPFLGVGLNHFTLVMASYHLTPEVRNFLYPVHNTFLLFFSELGIPAGLFFLIFVLLCLAKTWQRAHSDWIRLGVWIGAASFMVNSQFQTLFNLDPTLEIFIVMLAYLTSL